MILACPTFSYKPFVQMSTNVFRRNYVRINQSGHTTTSQLTVPYTTAGVLYVPNEL